MKMISDNQTFYMWKRQYSKNKSMTINTRRGPPTLSLSFHFQKGVISHGMCQAKSVTKRIKKNLNLI